MINNNYVLICIKKYEINYIIKLLLLKKVNYRNIRVYNKCKGISIEVSINSLEIIYGLFGKENISIIKYYGLNSFKYFIKNNYISLVSIFISLCLLFLLSNTIFEIEIRCENDSISKVISNELENYNIKKYRLKRDYNYINSIKNEILNNHKDILEWIEIDSVGTKYIVDVTERVIRDSENNNSYTDIVSKKDALIMKLIKKNGTVIKEVNDYVHKGEVIITGNVYKDDKIVNQTHASGEVYGEVWYTVNATIPFNYVTYETTGEVIKHYYLDIFGKKMTLIGKYNTNYGFKNSKVIIDKPYLFFKVVKEDIELFQYKENSIDKDTALKEAIIRSTKAINDKLSKGEYIIDKKVLKINEYSSKIDVEIFYRVYENILEEKEIEIIEQKEE